MDGQMTKVEWRHAGGTYYAVRDDGVVAILYCVSGPELGLDGGPNGDPLVLEGGWFVVFSDQPEDHMALTGAPALAQAMSDHEMAAINDRALDEATRMLVAH